MDTENSWIRVKKRINKEERPGSMEEIKRQYENWKNPQILRLQGLTKRQNEQPKIHNLIHTGEVVGYQE